MDAVIDIVPPPRPWGRTCAPLTITLCRRDTTCAAARTGQIHDCPLIGHNFGFCPRQRQIHAFFGPSPDGHRRARATASAPRARTGASDLDGAKTVGAAVSSGWVTPRRAKTIAAAPRAPISSSGLCRTGRPRMLACSCIRNRLAEAPPSARNWPRGLPMSRLPRQRHPRSGRQSPQRWRGPDGRG